MKNSNLFYNPKRTRSYGCMFNFVHGGRGTGKTYSCLKDCIERYLTKGEQFMYVRRYATELEKLTKCKNARIFNAVQKDDRFKGYNLTAESNVLYCNKNIIGYAQPLSTSSILKSDAFPDVTTMIFDEYLIDNTGTYHYLKDEVRKFLDMYETVARPGTRDKVVNVFFLANAISQSNPYFEEFNLHMPYKKDIQRFGQSKDILVENVRNEAYIEQKHNTRFGQLIAGTEYSDYAIDNKWLLDNNDFIEKKTQRSKYRMSIRYKDQWFGVWFDELQYIYYISNNVNLEYPVKYSATTDDHKPNTLLLARIKHLPEIKNLLTAYDCGAVRYETQTLKGWFRDIMRSTR